MRFLCFVASSWLMAVQLPAQTRYDLLLKGGRVLDPANNIDQVMDVAVSGGRIARMAKEIPSSEARTTIDVRDLYVTPGLIDLHAHHFGYTGALFPDDVMLSAGTTTSVDCGGAGWRNFDEFKAKIIDRATTRVLAFINIVGRGMLGAEIENNVEDMDPAATAAKMRQYPDLIVGIKTAHFSRPGWAAVERAVEAGRLSGKPVIIDNNILSWTGRDTRTKVLEKMRPGDIHTHTYNDRHLEIVDRASGKLQPYMVEARRRGVLFDLGHGCRKLSLAGGGGRRKAGIHARHDQHGSARQQHHGAAIRHAELYLEDDAARHEARRGGSPLHRPSRRNPAPLPRAGHTRGGAYSRRRRIQAGAGSIRIQRCLAYEAAGHPEVGIRIDSEGGKDCFRSRRPQFPRMAECGRLPADSVR